MSKNGAMMAKYRVLRGIDYPPNKRVEAGAIVDDLPPRAIRWLRDSGIIEPLDANAPVETEEPAEEPAAAEEAPAEEPAAEEEPAEEGDK